MARRNIMLVALIAVCMVAGLLLLGRSLWCACGGLFLWSTEVHSSHNSQHLLDAYSFSHFQHGFFFYLILYLVGYASFPIAILLEALWEVLENSPFIIERYRSATFSLNYYGDSIANSLGDLLSCALGYYFCLKLPWKIAILLYIVIEVVMLILIRDSLTLNVIMLLYPLDSIRSWQSA